VIAVTDSAAIMIFLVQFGLHLQPAFGMFEGGFEFRPENECIFHKGATMKQLLYVFIAGAMLATVSVAQEKTTEKATEKTEQSTEKGKDCCCDGKEGKDCAKKSGKKGMKGMKHGNKTEQKDTKKDAK
jgi:hypothetical protein